MNTRDKDPKRAKKIPANQGRSPWPRHGRTKARRSAARERARS
jgi:hypothetical protein